MPELIEELAPELMWWRTRAGARLGEGVLLRRARVYISSLSVGFGGPVVIVVVIPY